MQISEAITRWLTSVKASSSINTFKTCESASKAFLSCVSDAPIESLNEKHYSKYLTHLKTYSPSTEHLYATLMFAFFEYVTIKFTVINMTALKYSRRKETRKVGTRLKKIDQVALAQLRDKIPSLQVTSLPLLRAKALVILALECGLRISELCSLRKRNVNFLEFYGTVIGKGDKEVMFFFTERSVKAIAEYQEACAKLEPERGYGIAQSARPIFLSHSKRHAKILKDIDSDTARTDVENIVDLVLKSAPEFKITPHSFRHFFVTTILDATHNPETARKAVHHVSIKTTQGYMHTEDEEIQKLHHDIFGRKN